MTETYAQRLIDTLTDYILGASVLPSPVSVVRYRRPVIVLPDDCPLLCVWLLGKEAMFRTTNDMDGITSIGISYQVEAVERAETLQDDPKRAIELLDRVSAIEGLIRTLGKEGWAQVAPRDIPEAYEVWPSNIDYTPPTSMETGLVEGYALTVRVMGLEQG